MSNAIISLISAVIGGGISLVGVLIANSKATAVMEEKIAELTREVRAHNNFARRMPVVEEQIKVINHRLADLEDFHKPDQFKEEKSMKMTNKTYDVLKWIALILLPALATFYAAIAAVWGLPYTEQVVGTITAVDTLLGTLLKISSDNYKKQEG